jgi:hypothetical protein
MDEARLVVGLDTIARKIAEADSAPEVFQALMDGLPLFAPRAAAFLVGEKDLQGWRCFGYPQAISDQIRRFSGRASGPPSRIDLDGRTNFQRSGVRAPDFGQSAPFESAAVTVCVKEKPIVLIVAEHERSEEPWQPSALSLLVHFARLRLELSLAERKLRTEDTESPAGSEPATQPAPRSAPAPATINTSGNASMPRVGSPPAVRAPRRAPTVAPPAQRPAPMVAAPAPRPAPAVAPPARRPAPMVAPPAQRPAPHRAPSAPPAPRPAPAQSAAPPAQPAPADQDPRADAAKRFARLIAGEIQLYNEEAVVLGRQNGDLVRRLKQDIDAGRQSFKGRFGSMGPSADGIFLDALVDILAGGDASLLKF